MRAKAAFRQAAEDALKTGSVLTLRRTKVKYFLRRNGAQFADQVVKNNKQLIFMILY